MSNSYDYLREIARVRSPSKLAMLVRAFGLRMVSSWLHTPEQMQQLAKNYEQTAQYVESCKTWQEAKLYLRKKGYGC